MPTSEDHKALHRRYFEEVVVGGNESLIDELFHPDYVGHTPGNPDVGFEQFKAAFGNFRSTFSDTKVDIEHQVADDGMVVSHITVSGTHTGPLMGIPPTGNHVSYQGVEIVRIADGKIVEFWGVLDMLTMLQQLGVAPPS